MLQFLTGPDLTSAIEKILGERNGSFAVAFWGAGAVEKLHQGGKGDFRAICNLASGGTNPSEIRKLKRLNIRQCDTLHAKVYIGAENVVVSSANISSNGLGFEGVEQARWLEAGTLCRDIEAPSEWFEKLWSEAREITDSDLKKAEIAWKRRQRARPTRMSIDDFNPLSADTPLLYGFGEAKTELNPVALKTHRIDERDLERFIPIEPDGKEDKAALSPEKWVLAWDATEEGVPYRRNVPRWFYTGRLITKAFRFKGKRNYQDAVIESEHIPSVPFHFDAQTKKLFYDVLCQPEFDEIRTCHFEGAWFTKRRVGLMRRFWLEFAREHVARRNR